MMTMLPAKPGLIWLASYPKSGNTWVRLFLSALESNRDVDLARMDTAANGAASRSLLQAALGIGLSDLSRDEVADLLPLAYRRLAELGGDPPAILKVHSAYHTTPSGQPLFPPDATYGCIHLVRDPRDVCLSLAAHNGVAIDRAIDQMGKSHPPADSVRKSGSAQVDEFRGSWSSHGESWLAAPVRRLTVRYEDMVASPLDCLGRIAAFCGLPADADAVALAVERTAFDRLAAKEPPVASRNVPTAWLVFFAAVGSASGAIS
ncbi:sulfotransferase domain-containing protein [Azospirillum sp. B506]|uniref:sulfotransferase domain-containing protein n=1 Tax=Azospirillum sp. B506 TaxID=137721 RepID=UPI000348E16E|nr:sulfotransferase domain-containing protein [Azospirillum sp. B506]